MEIKDIPFSEIPQFSAFDKAYIENNKLFQPFYNRPPLLSAFSDQYREKKNNYSFNRRLLTQVIEDQYLEIDVLDNDIKRNIQLLEDQNTFTVITAHQPSLFTGPLYFIYKIISTIQLARKIEDETEDVKVLPVFIIGGEDHDFEEINHFNYKEHQFKWKESSGGAVGRMSTEKISEVLNELAPHLGKSFYGKEILDLLQSAYSPNRTLSQATQYFIARLFKHSPLLAVSMDSKPLKEAFIPFIKKEILEQPSQELVEKTQAKLEDAGFSPQAYARQVNFFYIHEGLRSRLAFKNGTYYIVDTDRSFSKEEIVAEIDKYPERFSPNVVMRPLYQEFVFPNLAYVGGGGELAYWMERKSQFQEYGTTYPILIRRHSATIVDNTTNRKARSFEWEWKEWFWDKDKLIAKFLDFEYTEELDFSSYHKRTHLLFDELNKHLSSVDPSLDYSTEAARSDALEIIKRLRTKLHRSLKQKEQTQLNRLEAIRDHLIPEGNLQERHQNFISFYEKYGPELFRQLEEAFIPFDVSMKMLIDPE